jgi:hypothetical protein
LHGDERAWKEAQALGDEQRRHRRSNRSRNTKDGRLVHLSSGTSSFDECTMSQSSPLRLNRRKVRRWFSAYNLKLGSADA